MTVSLELVLLMQWLLKYKQEEMRDLVESALMSTEFTEALIDVVQDHSNQELSDEEFAELTETIDTFFLFMDESLHGKQETSQLETLSPHIRAQLSGAFSPEEIELSLTEAAHDRAIKMGGARRDISDTTRETLLAHLLQNWNPHDSDEDGGTMCN